MKISIPFRLSALVPLFVLCTAALPPADTSTRMTHLRFQVVPEPIPVGHVGTTEARFLITNVAQYEQLFGEGRITINFETEWALFYSAGLEPTTGYEASVLDVGYVPDTRQLVFTTQLAAPGRNCVVNQMLTMPYTVVKFPRPARRAEGVRYVTDDVVVDCR
jgi:hypothetical protein